MAKLTKTDLDALGTIVNVTMDRPIGTRHPKHNDIIYPINYGYIEGLIAGDGEEQDVYVLGVQERLDTFCGTVIAIINRKNDNENKWVACPTGQSFTRTQIRKAVHFQEQFYKSSIIMKSKS